MDREAAWSAVHDALGRLPGWRASPAAYHAEDRPERRWHVTAVDVSIRRRQARRDSLTGIGATEVEALEMLARLLGERARR